MRTTKENPRNPTCIARVNQAIDYVIGNLSDNLRLENVARAADLSQFHFHRVFQAIVGTTLTDFVKRRRLEKALQLMAFTDERSLTKIALKVGFASSSDFSRCFKQHYSVPPSAFDIAAWRAANRAELITQLPTQTSSFHIAGPHEERNSDEFKVVIRDLPARSVAYIRVSNPYREDAVWKASQQIVAWAEGRSLADGKWLGYQWENPEITPLKDCHYYVAVEAEGIEAHGEIGRYDFPPMTVAQVEVRGDIELELRALQWLYGGWLASSGYVPDDLPCFEAWQGRPYGLGQTYFELDVQLPVRRA